MRKKRYILVLITLTLVSLNLLSSTIFDNVSSGSLVYVNPESQSISSYGAYDMIQYPLPNGSSSPWSITVDGSGNVWFVQQGPSALVMLNPSNQQFTQYSFPSGTGASPESVTVDKSGNVWFSELVTEKLGELKKGASSVIEYSIPGGNVPFDNSGSQYVNCGPTIVKTDSSGNVWISCIYSNQIDEFFPNNGTFHGYDLPLFQSSPAGFVFDRSGNLWFTAADVDMIGKAVPSELRNGTTNGITEFAPINSTYSFIASHETALDGPIQNITSSLPTPSGIALSPDGSTLWITEHVDSSFDSYNINTKSLDKYWTSQTYDKYGYTVSFPNGIAIDSEGNVWISEHYGNKIAEFVPSTNRMFEFPIPCCSSDTAGPYNLALGPNGTVWFVEITGGAIGELKPSNLGQTITLVTPNSAISIPQTANVNIPFQVIESGGIQGLSLNVSGISYSGALSSTNYNFAQSQISFVGNATQENDSLNVNAAGLKPGTYYITLSATSTSSGEIYSSILKLVITSSQTGLSSLETYAIIGSAISSVCVVAALFVMSRRPKRTVIRRRR
jgi:streptogramin lyase